MKVNVIGLGYIGLPTSLTLARFGVQVIGTDYNEKLVNSLNQGILTFEEEGLKEAFDAAVLNKIVFTTQYCADAEYYIVAVPTPYNPTTKKIDVNYVVSAVTSILEVCQEEAIIIVESTISPNTIHQYIRPIVEKQSKKVHLAHAPERIIPGSMFKEIIQNSRTIGADSPQVAEKIKKLYQTFCQGEILLTNIATAEMTKVVENTYRDINIAFANELSRICHQTGLDVYEVIRIANHHPRVNILSPGPGVGGHCISVDPWFLVGDFPDISKLIHQARLTNDSQPQYVWNQVLNLAGQHQIKTSEIGIYGLSYKENVDDIRESPTLQLIDSLPEDQKDFSVYDPYLHTQILNQQVMNFDEFMDKIKLLVIFVAHQQIKNVDFGKYKSLVVFDTKRINNKTLKNFISL